MRLIDNWKRVLKEAWSAWGLYLLVFSGLLNDYIIPTVTSWMLGRGVVLSPGYGTFVSVVAGVTLFVRVVQQVSMLFPKR